MPLALSAWGLASSPFDCWLAARGMATMHLRVRQACQNAAAIAQRLCQHDRVSHVDYPGLTDHPQHELAVRQFRDWHGYVLTFHLDGISGDRFIQAAKRIAFCPSLGDNATTFSHPRSTSHRGLTDAECAELGIGDGTIRLSCGIESVEFIAEVLQETLKNAGNS